MLEEIAAGRVGATFNSVTRSENRPLQEAAVRNSRLGIPIFFAYDVIHGHRTTFPIGLGLASIWDMDLVSSSARIAAIEASRDALDMTFAPMVDIARDPRWGRTSEGFGEDPFLVSESPRARAAPFQASRCAIPATRMPAASLSPPMGAAEAGPATK